MKISDIIFLAVIVFSVAYKGIEEKQKILDNLLIPVLKIILKYNVAGELRKRKQDS